MISPIEGFVLTSLNWGCMNKILITGANGYVGSHLSQSLIDLGKDVRLTDIAATSILSYPNYIQVDFRNEGSIRSVISDVDTIYFFTGRTGNSREGFEEPSSFIEGNVITLVNLLKVVKDMEKKPRIIFPSTRLLYEGKEGLITEDSAMNPKSVYSINKMACEQYLKIYGDCFGIDYTIFRISLPYGKLIKDDRVSYGIMSYLVDQARGKNELYIFGDGKQKGSFIHIEDLVQILIKGGLHQLTKNQTYNIGGPDNVEMRFIIQKIADKYNVAVKVVEWPEEAKLTDQGDLVIDSSRILDLIGYKYKFSIEKWLNQIEQ